MFNEIIKRKAGHWGITWGLIAVVIILALQSCVEASKPKTLDVIPIGGSDEFYSREYVPPPRPPPPAPKVPPPPPPPPMEKAPPIYPPPLLRGHNKDGSDEYYIRARNRQRLAKLKAKGTSLTDDEEHALNEG